MNPLRPAHPLPRSTSTVSLARRRFFGLALVLGGAGIPGLLTACSAPAPSPTVAAPTAAPAPPKPTAAPATAKPAAPATQAPAKAKEVVKVRFGLPAPFNWQAPYYLGQAKGIYAKYGIELEPTNLDADPVVLKALISGEFDASDTNPPGVLIAIGKGAPLKLIGAVAPRNLLIVAARKEVQTLRDLYGKTVGHAAPNDLLALTIRALFKQENLDIKQVEFVSIGGSPALVQAMSAGKIHGAAVSIDFTKVVNADPNLHVLFQVSDRLPDLVFSAITTRDQLIQQRPEVVQNLMLGTAESIRYVLEHKAETIDSNVNRTKQNQDAVTGSYETAVSAKIWDPDAALPASALAFMQKLNQDIGEQDSVLPDDKVANFEFQRKTVAQLGAYKR